MKKYKLKIEISPLGKLSPRFFISDWEFKKIRKHKIETLGLRCESCGNTDRRMELHESFTIKNNTYIFDGFYLLCTVCHDAVHYITMASYLDNSIDSFEYKWRYKDVLQKYSIYKNAKDYAKDAFNKYKETFNFIMSKDINADYTRIEKYGLSPLKLKKCFEEKYCHSAKIKLTLVFLLGFYNRHWKQLEENPNYYYLLRDIHKGYKLDLYDEYLRHQHFYIENHSMLFGSIKSKERDKIISDYANEMMISTKPELSKEDLDLYAKTERDKPQYKNINFRALVYENNWRGRMPDAEIKENVLRMFNYTLPQ